MARTKNRRNRRLGALDRLRRWQAGMLSNRERWLAVLSQSPGTTPAMAEKQFDEIYRQRERDIATLEQRLSLDLGGGRGVKKEDNGASQPETEEG